MVELEKQRVKAENDVKKIGSEIGLIESIKVMGDLLALALHVDEDTEEKKSES